MKLCRIRSVGQKGPDFHQPPWHADQDEPILRCKVSDCMPVSPDTPRPDDNEGLSLLAQEGMECAFNIGGLSYFKRLEAHSQCSRSSLCRTKLGIGMPRIP